MGTEVLATTAALPLALSTGSAMVAGAIGGAVGSIASQGMGIAMGMQKRVDWSAVGAGALGGAISAGVGQMLSNGPEATRGFATMQAVKRAAVSTALTQGISSVTKMQGGFSWRGVAAATVSSFMGQTVTEGLGSTFDGMGLLGSVAKSTVSGIAAGVTAKALSGGKVDFKRVAIDAFGNALGTSLTYSSPPPAETPMPIVVISPQQLKNSPVDVSQLQDLYRFVAPDELDEYAYTAQDIADAIAESDRDIAVTDQASRRAVAAAQLQRDRAAERLVRGLPSLLKNPVEIVYEPSWDINNPLGLRAERGWRETASETIRSIGSGLPATRLEEQQSIFGAYGNIYNGYRSDKVGLNDAVALAWGYTKFSYLGSERAQGGVQMAGGALEIAGGFMMSSTGIGAPLGAPVTFHGGDNFGTGLMRLTTGRHHNTVTYNGVETLTGSSRIAAFVDSAIPMLLVPFAAGTFVNMGRVQNLMQGANSTRPPVVLDLFGGRTSQTPGAINVDIVATEGVRASALQLPFKDGAAGTVIATNPYLPGASGMADFLPEATRVLQPGGQMIINSTARNPFGTLPSQQFLDELGLTVVQNRGPLLQQFQNNTFRLTDPRWPG